MHESGGVIIRRQFTSVPLFPRRVSRNFTLSGEVKSPNLDQFLHSTQNLVCKGAEQTSHSLLRGNGFWGIVWTLWECGRYRGSQTHRIPSPMTMAVEDSRYFIHALGIKPTKSPPSHATSRICTQELLQRRDRTLQTQDRSHRQAPHRIGVPHLLVLVIRRRLAFVHQARRMINHRLQSPLLQVEVSDLVGEAGRRSLQCSSYERAGEDVSLFGVESTLGKGSSAA